MKTIAVYSSGGDAPGMNAAIRSVVRTGILKNLRVLGAFRGYAGIIDNDFVELNLGSVANIVQRGGTILKSGRCPEFRQAEGRKKAAENIKSQGIDALVCIGGDGSFSGAHLLYKEHGIPVVGVPGTIDNDIFGSDNSIGFDTAVNTALDAIDKVRDTATSHDRIFIVEVMGRDSGFIASHVGLAGGAEDIFTPEVPYNVESVVHNIQRGIARGKGSSILVTAEGQKPGRAYDLAESIRKHSGLEATVCILGHIQRGGSPTANDRILAARLGAAAVDALLNGETDKMLGVERGNIIMSPLENCLNKKKPVDLSLIELSRSLAH